MFSFRNVCLLLIPVVGISSFSFYQIVKHFSLISSIEHNYLSRVQLKKNSTSTSTSTTEISKLVEEDRERLKNFYREYGSKFISVNSSKFDSKGQDSVDLFIHTRTWDDSKNLNNLWFDSVHLNQLSIDRYGYEFDENGTKKNSSSNPVLKTIVNWKDIDLATLKYHSSNSTYLPHISFNFRNTDIPKEEVEILINEDSSKYTNTDDTVSNDWFVWLDKDLLALKLNYSLQTYVFHSAEGRKQTSITGILGTVPDSTSTSTDSRTDTQKASWASIESNEKELYDPFKKFAKVYLETFHYKSSSTSEIDWAKAANLVNKKNPITSEDINKIYNKFKKSHKDLSVFHKHIVTRISSGSVGNWKISLPLESLNQNKQEQAKFAAKKIEKIHDGSTFVQKNKNQLKIFLDPDLNPYIRLDELKNLLTDYSVKNFSLDTDNKYISSVYSSNSSKSSDIVLVFDSQRKNEFGF